VLKNIQVAVVPVRPYRLVYALIKLFTTYLLAYRVDVASHKKLLDDAATNHL